jgi:hypothetical protein
LPIDRGTHVAVVRSWHKIPPTTARLNCSPAIEGKQDGASGFVKV